MKALWFLQCILGFGSVDNGSLCWFSKKFIDLHDYKKKKGGDGDPTHFHLYSCRKCGAKFTI